MDKIEFKIIRRGFRAFIYKTRNASLIVSGLTLLIFMIGQSLINEMSAFRIMIAYSFIISVSALIVALLLTTVLFYKQNVGNITIYGDEIHFTKKESIIELTDLQILLNADRHEFENAQNNSTDLEKILETGNKIISENLPAEQTNWEVVLTKANKKQLLELKNVNISLIPQFNNRPLLMESPQRLLKSIAYYIWGSR
jgi:hypothetical protein